jgi:excisionase family DNA binding protein
MDHHSTAAESSLGRDKNAPGSNFSSNPVSETQLFGVAADGQRIADALEGLAIIGVRIADAIESLSRSVIQALPPVALSYEDAARYLGVGVPTVEHLVKTRQLPFMQYGSQRGRAIPVKDLQDFAKKHRQASDEEIRRKRQRA